MSVTTRNMEGVDASERVAHLIRSLTADTDADAI
jgi:hypothetical protein